MNLFEHIKSILQQNPKYCKNNQLFKNSVIEATLKLDSELLTLLINDELAKKHFFTKIDTIVVFDKIKFQKFISNKQFLANSYTAYKNKIGLTASQDYLTESKEVVLSWAYKDCILEGGQSKDEQKRKEIFWNQTLAPEEIDRLLEAKILTNWKRYHKKGEQEVKNISINDNLIIKGNNLLALHSLKKVYQNKIKLIYIDPPYNTGSDSFGYNDNFKQSTWLTFMKNRLEVAKDLLCKSGVLLVQCSFHQFAYLKVLMDEIFEKHLCDFNIQVRHPDRVLTGDKEFNDVIEYVLIYSNDVNKKMPHKEVLKTKDDYILDISIHEGAKPQKLQCDNKLVEIYDGTQYSIKKVNADESLLKQISIRGSIREKNSSGRFYVKHLEKLNYPPKTLFKVPNMGDDALGHRFFYSAPLGRKNGGYFQGMPTSSKVTKKPYPNFYNFEKQYNQVSKQGDVLFRNGKKPEELIKFLVELFSNQGDIILDYHLGSGTTAATAHKMNRQYIGIEQMDYIEGIAVARLKKVILGEQSGISEAVDWKGGGGFVYAELAKNNAFYIDSIENAENTKDLILIWNELKKESFISYKINVQEIDNSITEFKNLTFENQKLFLIEILDKNELYLNLSNIDDQDYEISKKVKLLNKQFYGME